MLTNWIGKRGTLGSAEAVIAGGKWHPWAERASREGGREERPDLEEGPEFCCAPELWGGTTRSLGTGFGRGTGQVITGSTCHCWDEERRWDGDTNRNCQQTGTRGVSLLQPASSLPLAPTMGRGQPRPGPAPAEKQGSESQPWLRKAVNRRMGLMLSDNGLTACTIAEAQRPEPTSQETVSF